MESPRVPEHARETKEDKEARTSKAAKEAKAKASKDDRGGVKRVSRKPKVSDGKRIFRDAFRTNFMSPTEAQNWDSQYKEKLNRRPSYQVTGSNGIFHMLAKKKDWPDDMQWADDKIKQFLDWALERYHKLLELEDEYNYMPLHLALLHGNTAFVEAVLKKSPKLVNLRNVLQLPCPQGNTLHVGIISKTTSINLLVEKCAANKEMFVKGQDRTGNTPLHICMSMDMKEVLEEVDSEAESSDDANEEDNDEDMQSGSYNTFEEDGREAKDQEWVPIETAVAKLKLAHADPKSPVAAGRRGSQPFPLQRIQSMAPPAATTPASEAAMEALLEVVKLLIKENVAVLWKKNDKQRTPYQERIWQLEQKHAGDEATLQKAEAEDRIAAYIRSFCVRTFPRERIMACLYKPGQERHIEFDLAGLPHAVISEDYLDRLQKHLRFERILKYVALPRLTMETPMVRKKKHGIKTTQRRGLTDLVAVFDWLRKNQVEKIVKVMVIDDGDLSHSDESIEDALRDFGVEVWDWKRLDLSTEVIYNATKVVQEICLYSTGNNAVLMGWASDEGLRSVTKFPELRVVNLFIREGLESPERLASYIDNFKRAIEAVPRKGGKQPVKVNHILDNKDISFASEFRSSEGFLQPENPWIDCVVNFARFIRRAPGADKIDPVKIAIIDDGVDASLIGLDVKIAIGKSFCPYANSTDLMNPYYVPSGNHGTCMATLICKLCPEVSLYVARLDERYSVGSNQRQITAKSAAEAIRWATNCDVDIISMSWTIEAPATANADVESLKTAVHDAAAKKILMFCSTSDQGTITKSECYPGECSGCFTIGGAAETGDALAWVNTEKVDFLLPGKNVPFTNNEGEILSHESGSSVATAAASGLAGLLLYCSWLLGKSKEDNPLRDQDNMRKAFKSMASGSRFPNVQDVFERRFSQQLARAREATRSDDARISNSKQQFKSRGFSKMDWDDRFMDALKWVINDLYEQ